MKDAPQGTMGDSEPKGESRESPASQTGFQQMTLDRHEKMEEVDLKMMIEC